MSTEKKEMKNEEFKVEQNVQEAVENQQPVEQEGFAAEEPSVMLPDAAATDTAAAADTVAAAEVAAAAETAENFPPGPPPRVLFLPIFPEGS